MRLGGNAPGRPVCGVLGGTNSGPVFPRVVHPSPCLFATAVLV